MIISILTPIYSSFIYNHIHPYTHLFIIHPWSYPFLHPSIHLSSIIISILTPIYSSDTLSYPSLHPPIHFIHYHIHHYTHLFILYIIISILTPIYPSFLHNHIHPYIHLSIPPTKSYPSLHPFIHSSYIIISILTSIYPSSHPHIRVSTKWLNLLRKICSIFAHETQWFLRYFFAQFAQNRKYFLRKLRMKRNFGFAQFLCAKPQVLSKM